MARRRTSNLQAAALLLALVASTTGCQETQQPERRSLAARFPQVNPTALQSTTPDGQPVRLLDDPGATAVVLVFVRTDCPIANRFAPEVNRLTAEFAPRGVRFWRVYPAADDTAELVAKHTADYQFSTAPLLDHEQRLAKALGASVTPEAVVLRPDGQIAYRGRIDDRFVDYGKSRSEPSRRDLAAALEEVLAGDEVSVPKTKAVGCPLEMLP
jgi:peroxiredoxin